MDHQANTNDTYTPRRKWVPIDYDWLPETITLNYEVEEGEFDVLEPWDKISKWRYKISVTSEPSWETLLGPGRGKDIIRVYYSQQINREDPEVALQRLKETCKEKGIFIFEVNI